MNSPRLRTPAEQMGVLAVPPLREAPALFHFNQTLRASSELAFTCQRGEAHFEALEAAAAYHREMGEPLPAFDSILPLIVSGHQPELVHPGVWAKNFVLQALARRVGAIPLHVLIDNDIAKTPSVPVPAGAHVAHVPLDPWQGEMPYEELHVKDADFLAHFPERLHRFTQGWPFQPLAAACWQTVAQSKSIKLGDRLAAGRRALERSWGCHNLEVPLSRLCQTRSFAQFALSLIDNAHELYHHYNDALRDARRAWRIKSHTHPVPDLGKDGDWLETPFWTWRAGERVRRRLFTRSRAGILELRAGSDMVGSIPGPPPDMVKQWLQLEIEGWKIRPRALTTTWFLRQYVGDLFVHGLGGGRYDQITDKMISAFEGRMAPRYLILTATLRLPLVGFPNAAGEVRRLARLERDLVFNPERHLPASAGEATRWVEEKRAWRTGSPATQKDRRERFLNLRRLNEALQPFLGNQRDEARTRRRAAEQEARRHEVQSRRDYAFSLYPQELLREFMQRFLHADHQLTT